LSESPPDFRALFGVAPETEATAPGRVNLIGEHTDYNGGYVLPLAISQRTRAELRQGGDREVRAWSANVEASAAGLRRIESYRLGGEARGRGWLDYVQGVTRIGEREGLPLAGFALRIESQVPPGSGLSSSAALTVALLRALRAALGWQLAEERLALLAQRVETDFVGAPVGIMDPMAVALAETGSALFLDTRSLQHETVPLPASCELAVIDSGTSHRHSAGGYRLRREECEEAARRMGVDQLRELDVSDLPRLAKLPPPLDRRARHVITENGRVLAAVRAMRAGDAPALGRLLSASHRSLAVDFAVSTPEIDSLVELAHAAPEVFGARLTGGGFGGSVVLLARPGTARATAHRIATAYSWRTGRAGAVVVPPAAG
jgi:galactokinase